MRSFLRYMTICIAVLCVLCLAVSCDKNGNENPQTTEPEVTKPEVTKPEVTEPEVTEPEVTEPEATEPEVTEPEVTEPEVTEPEVTEPEVTEPEITEPEVTEPEVTEPEVTEPEVTEPEVTEPEVTEPEVTEPEVTEPEVTEPEVTEPEVTEPEETEPEVTEPEVTEPEVTEPEVTEPEVTEPEVTEPEVTEPEVTEPEVTEPEVTEPEVTEPEVTEPEVTEPEVTEPEVTEPEVTEPEVTEPEVTEPEVTEPEVTEPEVTEPEVTEPEVTEPEVTEPEETEPEPIPTMDYNLNDFILIRSETANQSILDSTLALYDAICKYASSVDIGDDWYYAGDADKIQVAKEILYGKVNREESQQAIDLLPENKDYVIAFFEYKIVIYGRTNQSLELAANEFVNNYVKKSEQGTIKGIEEGTVIFGVDPALDATLSPRAFNDYPRFDRVHADAHLCSEYGVQYLYTEVTNDAVSEYITRLLAAGFEKTQENSADGNRTATFLGNGGMVHLAYQTSAGALVVSADNGTSDLFKKPAEGSWEKLTSNSFAVMTMDYSQYSCSKGCNPRYDNNGLSYVITLEDGRFIIYDGGYESPNDSEILYEFLRDTNKREGLPVIAAWIFTHSHADHYGAFKSFTSNHAKDVVLEAMVLNTGKSTCYTGGHDTFLESVDAYGKTYYKTEQIIKLHVGQQLYFGNVMIEALYTHEMFHFDARNLTNENSASFVTRVWIDGMSLLMLGDAGADTCLGLAGLFPTYVKSDFMQIAHHGNGGGRRELYRIVDPDYMLWTTSQPGFRRRTAGSSYSVGMPDSYIAKLNKEMFELTGGVREGINENGATNAEGVQTNWCADGPVDILTFGENKTISISYYEIREELLPNNPIEEWDAEFVPDNR